MPRRRRDFASVSFHFLQREEGSGGDNPRVQAISEDEFNALCDGVQNQPWPDTEDEATKEQLRNGLLVPFRGFERINERIAIGTFQTSYSGHAFHNTEKGKISATSLNQREFLYLLYLSEQGKVFIAAQYLGNYGGYESLRWGLTRHLRTRSGIKSYSFRRETYDPAIIRTKSIRVNISQKVRDDQDNVLTKKRVIVLERDGIHDEAFEDAARDQFIPIMNSDDPQKNEALAQLLGHNNLMSAADEDVVNCVMIVDIDGKEKRLQVLGDNHFATRFSLNVPYNEDGHPEFAPTVRAMQAALMQQIIEPLA